MIKKVSKCKICGEIRENHCYNVKEMFYGTMEEFTYFECSHCHCMQIMDIPDNMGQYYGDDYYSFEEVLTEENCFPETVSYTHLTLPTICSV